MPELPEVETMVRGIRPHTEGRKLIAVRRCRCACKPISMRPEFRQLAREVKGQHVTAVRRRAKRIVLNLESGGAFAIEPRMTGLMLLSDPPDRAHLRLEWRFDGAGEYGSLWFWDRRGLGTVRLYSPGELERELESGKLGPDALEMDADRWRSACRKTGREIKVALLDQKLAAGIGNLYASEILHLARIHPETPANQLSRGDIDRLSHAVQEVLTIAIACEGSTLGDGTYRNALNRNGSYQNEHRVYARADEICRSCARSPIVRIVQAQRSTFYCPACQRPARRRK